MSQRLLFALRNGLIEVPETGLVRVFYPPADIDLSLFDLDRLEIVQPFFPLLDSFAQRGLYAVPDMSDQRAALSIFCLPRAKQEARDGLAQAAGTTSGQVVVDGARNDGIEAMLRDLRARVALSGPISKAHGKVAAFSAQEADFADWRLHPKALPNGFVVAPGVFSADGVDPGSALLAQSLPRNLGRRVIDLGAGWGYLSAKILEQKTVAQLDMVEADHRALLCARRNIEDPRAAFHWADARHWRPADPADSVVMNPPFHQGRDGDPGLGRAFIRAAAESLHRHGVLWMVANRHLPYEQALRDSFGEVQEQSGDSKFKIIRAARPGRGTSA